MLRRILMMTPLLLLLLHATLTLCRSQHDLAQHSGLICACWQWCCYSWRLIHSSSSSRGSSIS